MCSVGVESGELGVGETKKGREVPQKPRSNRKPLPLAVWRHQGAGPKNAGKKSFSWNGPVARVTVMDPELIKEILVNNNVFKKPTPNPLANYLVCGLPSYEDEKWAKHRKIVAPAFYIEKLKYMFPAMYLSCSEMVSKWEKLVSEKGLCELNVQPYLESLTSDVISRTAFGSSYQEGRKIFQLQKEQAELTRQVLQSVYVPGCRYLPTKRNKRLKEINDELRSILSGIIRKREMSLNLGESEDSDLLFLLLKSNRQEIQEHGNKTDNGMSIAEVIEECKTFYFAGQESTSDLLVWTMVLLSMHPNWQVLAREEVSQVFGNNKPDYDGLNRLKIVTMILYEVLRLYSPGLLLTRTIFKETKLGELTLPAGVHLLVPVLLVHHDHEIWGEDVKEFKPERFAEGVAKATMNRLSFFPFTSIAISALLVIAVTWTIRLVNWVWLTPKKLEKCMREQGYSGNPYRLLLGDAREYATTMKESKSRSIKLTNDTASHVQPYIHHLIQKYGKNSFMWFGTNPRLNIGDPGLMKEILSKPDVFQKIHPEPLSDIIVGGLLTSEDEKWTNHRKIINPAFHLEKLKELARFFPTKANKRMNQICIELQVLLGGIVNKRVKDKEMGKKYDDSLGILMESNSAEIQEHGIGMSIEEVMEECKLFYLAGSETTSNLLVWTMILLSMHPNWQTSAREEVFQVFGTEEPNFDGLNRLKIVTMILNEVLRLYPPVTLLLRAIYKKTKLGNMNLPAGMQFNLPIILLHHNCDIWGEDAQEFKPERFSEGVSNATRKSKFSFLPFGGGPRICIGQNFAMIEAKMAVAMILQRFSFELSPSYKHAPFAILTLQPQYGAPLILNKL
ncbi:hypothetical protein RJ639_013095 [Escallonia herrerae]|uniref:Cytochrome P450 n=1 Tax=Escallonia herrerae TaxID=1293975 RepID=A0AA89AM67_9ASTE|nr:hypothetical protein RJ639_013095 [Escallonia herrerae]